jgi:methyltransferase (TIGR00027 family)
MQAMSRSNVKEERPSVTAAIVATFRSLGDLLPADVQLAHDPYGAKFVGPWMEKVISIGRRAPVLPGAIARYVMYMQLRTRAIDDVLLAFLKNGGRQLVLLGAGFDARALRFAPELAESVVYEIDHPATQNKKRAVISAEPGSARVQYLTFNFEERSVAELPSALADAGHRRDQPTLTIWEGVTMYLTEEAVSATLSAVREYSCPGSLLAVTYFERTRMIQNPGLWQRVVRTFVSGIGEPFRFGWDVGELEPWAAARGFEVVSDEVDAALAQKFFPPELASQTKNLGRHVAVLRAV